MTCEAKSAFVEALGLREVLGERLSVLDLHPGNAAASLDNLSEPLALLYVEDFNTCGLSGNPHSAQSHFNRLLLSLGDGSKSRAEGSTGGSYGYGKAVYSSNSRVRTIVAYSTFDEDETGGPTTRLMGCSYFNGHTFNGEEFAGRAWFGVQDPEIKDRIFAYEDEDAHKIARSLGFTERLEKETGTSILIVDRPVSIDELRKSVEEWWWPRILEDGLDIEFEDAGVPAMPPRPRSRPYLQPFIRCFEMAIETTAPLGKQDSFKSFNRLEGRELGRYGLTLLDPDLIQSEESQIQANRIALIRTPRMVVAYLEVGSLALDCVGAFVAAGDADRSLMLSEPPAHDKWDPHSTRFDSDFDRKVVDRILDRIRSDVRRFAKEAVPKRPASEVRLSQLERLLGKMFRPPAKAGKPAGASPADPIEIRFELDPSIVASGDTVRSVGKFSVGLREDADREDTVVTVEVTCLLEEEGNDSSLETVPVTVEAVSDGGTVVTRVSDNAFQALLSRQSRPAFQFKSVPYRADWSSNVNVSVNEE